HHDGKKNADSAPMKVSDHLSHAFHSARQIAKQIVLVPSIDPYVGIGVPDQYAVNSAIAAHEIVKVAVYGVAAGEGVMEIPVVEHHFRPKKNRQRLLAM